MLRETFHNGRSGTNLRRNIVFADFRCFLTETFIVQQMIENGIQFRLVGNGKRTAEADQIDSFLETFVLRTENDRAAESDRLLNVMDVDAKAAANVHETRILIKLRQNPNGVQHQNLAFLCCIKFGIKLII